MSNSFFLAKHLRISEKKCTFAAKKRTKQPIFLGKSGQNAIQFLGKSGQNKQNRMINRQLDTLIKEHYTNTHNALLLSGARQVGKSYAIRKYNALDKCLECKNFHIQKSIVLCHDNVQTEEYITYMPIYMTMFMKKHSNTNPVIYTLDISDLA